jgi:cytochrome c556
MNLRSLLRIRPLLTLTACAVVTVAGIAQTCASTAQSSASAQHVIETRRDGFNTIGWASKAINDQLRTRTPDLNRIATAAATIDRWVPEIANWFPAGSGPESRLDTKALPEIWTKRTDFESLARQLVLESQRLKETAATQNVDAIRTQYSAVRQVCSRCHRAYLAD